MFMPVVTAVDISELTAQQVNAVIAAMVAIGTLYCFLGYRTLRFALGLLGFLMAGGVAATLVNWLTQGNQTAALVALALGGVCGAFALYFLYQTGVFFLGLLGAALVAHNLLGGRPETWIPLAVLGVALLGGLFALLLERPVMIFATAALGAWMVIAGIGYFVVDSGKLEDMTRSLESGSEHAIVLGTWAVLSIAGVLSQFATTKRKVVTKNA